MYVLTYYVYYVFYLTEQFVPAIGESKGSLLNRVLESTLVTAESAADKDATATKFSLKIDSTRLDANNSEGPNLSLQGT